MYALTQLEFLDYLGFHKYLEEGPYNFIDLEFTNVYNQLEGYITAKNYNNNIKQLKEPKELKLLSEQARN